MMILDDPRCVSRDEGRISLSEVYVMERKLWEAIGAEGPVGPEVRRLYQLVVSRYEAIVLGGGDRVELQEVEYSLWKLHYVHIEEFRKRLKKGPAAGSLNGGDGHAGEIELFLSEAAEYYKGLVSKMKELLENDGGGDMPRTRTRKFLCHRFLVCIGDLARYKELYQFAENRDCDWSVAAAYYVDAMRLWPEGGNPHNQLALLATYVGDDFLALYHCVRSLAVNEPFPDAWKNLAMLLDKCRSATQDSVSNQVSFDFSKPSEKLLLSPNHSSLEELHSAIVGRSLWQNFIRTISFFLIDFSLVDFKAAFAFMVKELELLMELDDVSLNNALESHQFMNPSRTGPFRAIQTVSVFIFVIQSLVSSPAQEPRDVNGMMNQNCPVEYAIAAMFIFVGRLVNRCLETAEKALCPLLPAVLVFSEWLATSNLDSKEISGGDEMSRAAKSYFFRSFVRLLNILNSQPREVKIDGCALWEDYELRGFSAAPTTQAYLDSSYDSEHETSYRSGHKCRVNRLIVSGIKIAKVSHEWFLYDEKCKEFRYAEKAAEGSESQRTSETASEQSAHGRSSFPEEEEVILFKPLARHNSAPASKLIMLEGRTTEDGGPTASPVERLRRTSTVLPTKGEGGNQSPSLILHDGDEEASSSWELPVSSGPPSLSAWVVDGKTSVFKKEKVDNGNRVQLPPIEETLANISIFRTPAADDSISVQSQESVITHYPCPPYSVAVPSAPLLPEDTVYGAPGNHFSAQPPRIIHPDRAAAASGFPPAPAPSLTGFVDVYPLSHPMTSSEWLRQFREINNLPQDYNNGPRRHGPSPFHDVSVPRHEPLLQQWGNALPINVPLGSDHLFFYTNNQPPPQPGFYLPAYGSNEHYRRERVSYVYPRASPYGYVPSKNDGVDQETLLRYLKQAEWCRLQKDPDFRGPTF
ncbi:hypothetical protein MLD38_010052 [Melastoma candidum]|uniref:Uncharacterized protein n=1 Tax=Melastoma candidum TaxID=119954 RepID=A0ACB9QZ56_9MYRT|nr:hypothetical protein MLD38_010052 [Melastoma candidum]